MIERWGPKSLWAHETESITQDGESLKKTGYSPIARAYYSADSQSSSTFSRENRCARAIVIRNVEPAYWAPLGTWVVREATRRAMARGTRLFPSLTEAIDHAGYLTVPLAPPLCPGPRKSGAQKTLDEY